MLSEMRHRNLTTHILEELLKPVIAWIFARWHLRRERKKDKCLIMKRNLLSWMLQSFALIHLHTTSVMLRIFRVMASLSWLGVGVNHSFWNVSFTSFWEDKQVFYLYCVENLLIHSFISKTKRTLIPSSSLTLRIIFTHISVILWKSGCSKQISLRILMTLFRTLIPVSCGMKNWT